MTFNLSFLIYKHSEQWQAGGEEFFVCLAIVAVGSCALATACTADGVKFTLLALFGYCKAFTQEFNCLVAMSKCIKILVFIVDIAE